MEEFEFEEAEILWPAAAAAGSDDVDVVGGEAAPMSCSVRPKTAAPVEISRRNRRCRPWRASESEYHTTTFDQETTTDVGGEEDEGPRAEDSKKATTGDDDGAVVVPPHVVVARRRRLVVVGGRTAAYSMCAGKGRTLKGRDLRDVRNLVLRMTGFIEE